jgi:ketosteroid isomerase-like protein
MGDEAAEVVRRIYGAFARNDPAGALALIDPGVEIEYQGAVPDACGSYRGYEGMGKLLQTILGSFDVERFEVTPERIVPINEGRVVVGLHQRGVGAASGAEVEIRVGQVWTIRGGKAVRWEIYPDLGAAADAAGADLGDQ